MTKNTLLFISFVLTFILIGCSDYKIEGHNNPYDPKNPYSIKITALDKIGKGYYPSWSFDGNKIAYYDASNRTINVFDVNKGGEPEKLGLVQGHAWETSPRWSPVENAIAYIHSPDFRISKRYYPGTESYPITFDGDYKEGNLVWSPDGKRLASIKSGQIKILDSDGGESNVLHIKDLPDVSAICDWSPDGRKIMAISGDEPCAYIVDIETGSKENLLADNTVLCWGAAWSMDGSKILYVTLDNGRYELWMMNADRSNGIVVLTKDINPFAYFIRNINWSKKDESEVLFVGSDKFYKLDELYICIMKMKPAF